MKLYCIETNVGNKKPKWKVINKEFDVHFSRNEAEKNLDALIYDRGHPEDYRIAIYIAKPKS